MCLRDCTFIGKNNALMDKISALTNWDLKVLPEYLIL